MGPKLQLSAVAAVTSNLVRTTRRHRWSRLRGVVTAAAMTVRLSDQATVHVKDQLSGPDGFIPFARVLLRGLAGYQPKQSRDGAARARLRD